MMMECPYCKISWNDEEGQYCPQCKGFISVRKNSEVVSKEQIMWVIVSGFSSYFVLLYLLYLINITNLPFSNEMYLGLSTSLFMTYRLFWSWATSKNESLNDYFPYYKEFLITTGILIWFTAILIKLIVDYIAGYKAIEFAFIVDFTVHFFEGFILGLLLMTFYYYNKFFKDHAKSKLQT